MIVRFHTRNWCAAVAASALSLAVVSPGCASRPKETTEVAYRRGHTEAIEVFDLARARFARTGLSYLSRRDGHREPGVDLAVCSDAEYHCVLGPLAFAVPRTPAGQMRWEFHGIRCESDLPLAASGSFNIRCGHDGLTQVRYSPALGVRSYFRDSEPDATYELIDPYGLFAETNWALDRQWLARIGRGGVGEGYRGAQVAECVSWYRTDGAEVAVITLDSELESELRKQLRPVRPHQPQCWFLTRKEEIQLIVGKRCDDEFIVTYEQAAGNWVKTSEEQRNLLCELRELRLSFAGKSKNGLRPDRQNGWGFHSGWVLDRCRCSRITS